MTYTVARFDVEASNIPLVWKAASKNPGRYRTDTTCLLIHDSRSGTSWEDCLETRGEPMATDGRKLVRFELRARWRFRRPIALFMGPAGPVRSF